MTSTESRPVVALYTSPSRISGADPWPADGNDEAVSLHDTSDTLAWESLPWDTHHFCLTFKKFLQNIYTLFKQFLQ